MAERGDVVTVGTLPLVLLLLAAYGGLLLWLTWLVRWSTRARRSASRWLRRTAHPVSVPEIDVLRWSCVLEFAAREPRTDPANRDRARQLQRLLQDRRRTACRAGRCEVPLAVLHELRRQLDAYCARCGHSSELAILRQSLGVLELLLVCEAAPGGPPGSRA